MLFKVSRFEIFNLRLKAFDIELEPIEAIAELASALFLGIDEYLLLQGKGTPKYEGQEYCSFEQFVEQAKISWIADQIFTFYSYLRKGGAILRKKFSDKFQIV